MNGNTKWDATQAARESIKNTVQAFSHDSDVLCYALAGDILRNLERLGWTDPYTIRVIVDAAGGKIEIRDLSMIDPPDTLETWEQLDPPATILRTKRQFKVVD